MEPKINDILTRQGIDAGRFAALEEQLRSEGRLRCRRLWAYYANPMRIGAIYPDKLEQPYRQAQEWGMPSRITGFNWGADVYVDGSVSSRVRKQVVVENDIAWRIDTAVDYLFGTMPLIHSLAADPARREAIEKLLGAIFSSNGGVQFLQQMALIGAVHGWVDVAVLLDAAQVENIKRAPGSITEDDTGETKLARLVQLQVVEPARALPLLDPQDASRVVAYVQSYEPSGPRARGWFAELLGRMRPAECIRELWTAEGWWRWRDEKLVALGGNSLGEIPIVHVQNTAVPFSYSGSSEVEALRPLQDELNTRLSDRAHRIAMQSFRMYFAKGVEAEKGLLANPPEPGRVWESSNPDAAIVELGGESSCTSEQQHIAEVREALDKISGVPPVAAGAIKNRLGDLTSAAALRITLMSLLARTQRKRELYGAGMRQICAMALRWLDHAGVFSTRSEEREVELHWASPLPENDAEKLAEGNLKLQLGVAKEVVLRELGY